MGTDVPVIWTPTAKWCWRNGCSPGNLKGIQAEHFLDAATPFAEISARMVDARIPPYGALVLTFVGRCCRMAVSSFVDMGEQPLNGQSHAHFGSPLRAPQPLQIAGFCPRGHRHARSRHWREHGDLQCRARRHVATAAEPRRRSPDVSAPVDELAWRRGHRLLRARDQRLSAVVEDAR